MHHSHSHHRDSKATPRHLSHLNFLFTGNRSRVYERTVARFFRGLYLQVIKDLSVSQLDKAAHLLDVGSGPGTLAILSAQQFPTLHITGLDLSQGMIEVGKQRARERHLEERVRFDVGDVAHLPYPDESFDIIVSTASLHHWQTLEQPFRELYRVLRPGGVIWIYDLRFIQPQLINQALTATPFADQPLQHRLVRTGLWPFALYRRFELYKGTKTAPEPAK